MKRINLYLALLVTLLSGAAQAQEVQELADRWTAAYNLFDSDGLGALYSEDAKLFVNALPTVSGREAIRAYWAEDMNLNNPLTVLSVTHAVDGFDMKLVHGNYQVLNRLTGVPLGQGRFAHIWVRVNGEWVLDRDMWNEPFEPYIPMGAQ